MKLNFTIFIKIVNILILQVSFIADASSMTQDEFVKYYMLQNESVLLIKSQYEASRGKFENQSSLTNTTLGLSPAYKGNSSRLGSNGTERSHAPYLSAKINQTSAYGLNASIDYSRHYDNDSPTKEYSLKLNEPLIRNAFGGADRLNRKASEAEHELGRLTFSKNWLKVCGEAHLLYLIALTKKNELEIINESLRISRNALAITEANYKKKLVRRIDFESARADFLNLEDEQSQKEIESKSALKNLASSWPREQSIEFDQIMPIQIDETKLKNLTPLRAKIEEQRSAMVQRQSEALISNSKIAFDLELSVGESEQSNSAYGSTRYIENWYMVGFKTEWPLWDNRYNGTRKMARAQIISAEAELIGAKKTSQIEIQELGDNLSRLLDSLERNKSRISLRESQVIEANRLLKLGRIEFEDYIRYRDSELREKIQQQNLEMSKWTVLLKLAENTGESFGVCPEKTEL